MNETYELFAEIRRIIDESGETPQGQMAMAIVQLDERLGAIEELLEGMTTFDHRGKSELRCRCENCR